MHLDQESYTTHNLISHYNDALFVQKLDKCRVITLSICIIFKIAKLFYNEDVWRLVFLECIDFGFNYSRS